MPLGEKSDAEMLSSDEEDDDFQNGLCFMAKSSQVNSSPSHSDSASDVSDTDLEKFLEMNLMIMKDAFESTCLKTLECA